MMTNKLLYLYLSIYASQIFRVSTALGIVKPPRYIRNYGVL